MSFEAADALVQAIGLYLAAGLVFAGAFHVFGLARVDPAARGAGWGFRLLITPALAALWPVMAARWIAALARGGRA